jgi:hypothetical protein
MVLFCQPHSQSPQQSNTTRRAEQLPLLRRRLPVRKDRMFIHIPYPKTWGRTNAVRPAQKVVAMVPRDRYSRFNPML